MSTELSVSERFKSCTCLCAVWHKDRDLCEGTAERRVKLKNGTGNPIIVCRPCAYAINKAQAA